MEIPSTSRAGKFDLREWDNVRIEIPSAECEDVFKKYARLIKQEAHKFPSELHRVYHNSESARLIHRPVFQSSMSPSARSSKRTRNSVFSDSVLIAPKNRSFPVRRSTRVQDTETIHKRVLRSTRQSTTNSTTRSSRQSTTNLTTRSSRQSTTKSQSRSTSKSLSPDLPQKRRYNRPTIASSSSSRRSTIELTPSKSKRSTQNSASINALINASTNASTSKNQELLNEFKGPLVKLSRRECFSASHRLHNPALTDKKNQELYGKCNNINGHGHNYIVFVVLCGHIDNETGMVYNLADLKVEMKAVLDKLDHKNIDLDVDFFKKRTSTVENIAYYIARSMKEKMSNPDLLYKVKVCETENNSACIYSKDLQ